MQRTPASPEALFEAYYEKPDAFETRSVSSKTLLQRAHLYFNKNEFNQAIELYQQLLNLPEFDQKDEAAFFMGISWLAVSKEGTAISTLSQIGSNKYREMAEWFIALAHLRQKNIAATKISPETNS